MSTSLRPPAFVWCIAGPHIGESLGDIVERKQRDIENHGWCLWAYGGMGNAHPETEVRRLAAEQADSSTLPLLMPNTGKKYPDNGVPFSTYRTTRAAEPDAIPTGMSPVTGGRSSWAFWVTSLELVSGASVDVGRYVAPYARRGAQPLGDYLKGSHGRACAALAPAPGQADERAIHIVAELVAPYAVFLGR